MSSKKSKCEFSSERSELLLRNFRESLARQSKISAQRAFEDSVNMPAPRFWVSEARAMRVVTMMMKGYEVLDGMHTEKRKMYMEIFRRVKETKEKEPEKPLGDIVFEVVNSPAPRSYITWQFARLLVKNRRR